MLAYCKHIDKEADSFFELLLNENIEQHHIPRYKKDSLTWLVDNRFVKTDQASKRLLPTRKAHVIVDLFENEFIVLTKQSKGTIDTIRAMERDRFVRFGSSLLAEPEADYFSYIMNNEKYDNALALRNKYEHGDPICDEDHRDNYSTFLILLVLIAVKIYDELETKLGVR